jgi:hypothetical protein
MCPSDVIHTVHGLDSGVDVDPAVGPDVIPAEAEKVCFSRCPYIYHSFISIIAPFPSLSSRYGS